MKLRQKHPIRQGGKRRRRLELAMFAPIDVNLPLADRQRVEEDPDAWVDELTDGEFADIFGPGWCKLTGRNVDHLVSELPASAA